MIGERTSIYMNLSFLPATKLCLYPESVRFLRDELPTMRVIHTIMWQTWPPEVT